MLEPLTDAAYAQLLIAHLRALGHTKGPSEAEIERVTRALPAPGLRTWIERKLTTETPAHVLVAFFWE